MHARDIPQPKTDMVKSCLWAEPWWVRARELLVVEDMVKCEDRDWVEGCFLGIWKLRKRSLLD